MSRIKYGTATLSFEHYGIAYVATRDKDEVRLYTVKRITSSQFREAFTVALEAFKKMDKDLEQSLKETNNA
jgi:hypothetical protein